MNAKAAAKSPYESRRNRLRQQLRRQGLDGLLVSQPCNITYLTGFTGEDSFLVVLRDADVLLSDSRFTIQIEEECPELRAEIRSTRVSLAKLAAAVARKSKISRIGFESAHLTVAGHEALRREAPRVDWAPLLGPVERLRVIKDRSEVAAIRAAIHVAERAMAVVRAGLQGDQTEVEVARDLEYQIRSFGGSGLSFPAIVAAGPRGALPHAPPTTAAIGGADFVLIDWGAVVGGYVSDLTRVFATGRISPKLERIYGVVLKAQQRAINKIKPGVIVEEVDNAARSVVSAAGFGKRFGHGLGHGIGLEVHEAPRLAGGQKMTLRAGMVVTVEPGIYLPGWGGVRIEDDVLVTRTGHEVLSSIPKQLADCAITL